MVSSTFHVVHKWQFANYWNNPIKSFIKIVIKKEQLVMDNFYGIGPQEEEIWWVRLQAIIKKFFGGGERLCFFFKFLQIFHKSIIPYGAEVYGVFDILCQMESEIKH